VVVFGQGAFLVMISVHAVCFCVWVGGGRTFICASGPSPPVSHMVACAWDAAVVLVWCAMHDAHFCTLSLHVLFAGTYRLLLPDHSLLVFELVSSAD
jgi:hypothetical protein